MYSILYTALVMFVSGACLVGGMLFIRFLTNLITKLVTIAIAKHKLKKIMKGEKE